MRSVDRCNFLLLLSTQVAFAMILLWVTGNRDGRIQDTLESFLNARDDSIIRFDSKIKTVEYLAAASREVTQLIKELKEKLDSITVNVARETCTCVEERIDSLRYDLSALQDMLNRSSEEQDHLEYSDTEPMFSMEELRKWYGDVKKSLYGMLEEQKIHEILAQAPKGSVILDIGANVGVFVDYALSHCPHCVVHVFEPVHEYLHFIAASHGYRKKNVAYHNVALGDENRLIHLWRTVKESNLGWNTLVEEKATEEMMQVPTNMRTLDSFHLQEFYMAKIDVEGSEYRVLSGMRETLQRMERKPTLLIEIGWGIQHPHWNRTMAEFEWLFDHGYQWINLTTIAYTKDVLLKPKLSEA